MNRKGTINIKIEQQLIAGLPKTKAINDYIVAHESGNATNTGSDSLEREVSFMTRNWRNAFVTHWVGGGGRVIQVAPSGYISWGAGPNANSRCYAQVELARTKDRAVFKKDYAVYVELLRQLAKEGGIPVKLDEAGRGIKTHEWISDNLRGTDHRDPYAYLNSMGISREQFKKDIANGITGTVSQPVSLNNSTVAANRWISKKGTAVITTPSGIILRGTTKGDNTAPIKLGKLATLAKGQAVTYDKVLVQKKGHVWVRQPRSGGYGWLPVANTVNGKVSGGYWVTGVRI